MVTAPSSVSRPWLLGPIVDVVVGAGVWTLPLVGLVLWGAASGPTLVPVVFAALALVVNGPHYAATIVRAWRARRFQLLAVTGTAAVLVVAVTYASPSLFAWLSTAYLTWAPWHYATQSHGIALVLLARGGAHPTSRERFALKAALRALALAAIVVVHTGPSEPYLLRLGVSDDVAVAAAVVGTLVAVVLLAFVAQRARRSGVARGSIVFLVALATSSLLWFTAPVCAARLGVGIPFVAAVVALAHCAQYLWFVWFVEGRVAFLQQRSFDGFAWVIAIACGGVALFALAPWALALAGAADLTMGLMFLQAIVNLHHFVVDGWIWKLRHAEVGPPVFSGHERARADRTTTSSARAALFTVPAALLFVLGVVDVLHVWARSDAIDMRFDALAFLHAPVDSALLVRDAQMAFRMNDADTARALLGSAIELAPWNADAQLTLAQLYVSTGRDEEARLRQGAMPAAIASRAESLVLFSGVAHRLGHDDDALALARTALERHGVQGTLLSIQARAVIGEILLARGKQAEARAELARALEDADHLVGDAFAAPDGGLLPLGVLIARADLALGQHDAALVRAGRMLELASKSAPPRADVAMRALVVKAKVFGARNDAVNALDAWQRALRVAPAAQLHEDEAQAWIEYATLLSLSQAPSRLRYACLLAARAATDAMPDNDEQRALHRKVDEAVRWLEQGMSPAELEAVRADPAAARDEVLAVSYEPDDGKAPDAPTP